MNDDPRPGLYGAGEAARLLGLPASMLRAYASIFAAVLSADAQGAGHGPGHTVRHRRYTLDDLEALGRAKALLATGLTYDAVHAQLAGTLWASIPRRSDDSGPGRGSPRARPLTPRVAAADPGAEPPAERSEATVVGPAPGMLDDLAGQLDAIARALDDQSQAIAGVAARLDALEARLARWEAAGSPTASGPAARSPGGSSRSPAPGG
ncbi:MAG: MerR family transcriptional regulator [Chloroflexota bacterium]